MSQEHSLTFVLLCSKLNENAGSSPSQALEKVGVMVLIGRDELGFNDCRLLENDDGKVLGVSEGDDDIESKTLGTSLGL
jgi:hypothetical protein